MILTEPIRYLIFHAIVILLAGLIAGFPYAKAITSQQAEHTIFAWKVAHSALSMGGILMISVALLLSHLSTHETIAWTIVSLFVVSGYAFSFALYLGAYSGFRGLVYEGGLTSKLVYMGNAIGAATSLLGTILLLYISWNLL